MISEGSKFNFAIRGINKMLQYINTENIYLKYFTILLFYHMFDQINAVLVCIRDFFQKQ